MSADDAVGENVKHSPVLVGEADANGETVSKVVSVAVPVPVKATDEVDESEGIAVADVAPLVEPVRMAL